MSKNTKNEEKHSIEVAHDDKVFASCTFETLGLHTRLCNILEEKLGFKVPTHIQAQAVPVILSGKHVLVNAATGTGKTLVYLAPVVHHLLLQNDKQRINRADGTYALVLVPTHELCMQVYETLDKMLHRLHWLVPGYIMGGESRAKEKARLRKGVSILVSTPGRLLDHLKNTSSFVYTNLRWLIFDEADRILELGYGKEIEEILTVLGSRQDKSTVQRQNLLLSATLNDKVNHLANISLENPVTIGLDDKKIQIKPMCKTLSSLEAGVDNASDGLEKLTNSSNGEYNMPAQLIQRYVKVSCGSRLVVLMSILKKLFEGSATQKIVVFFSTCDAVDFHYLLMSEFQWPPNSNSEAESRLFLECKTYKLHGNMDHGERRSSFNEFKTEKSALLLSTDVSARGLDFPQVRCIIQYDSPGEATEYVHRVGRTARLGERGDSLLFLQPIEIDYLDELKRHGVLLSEYPLLKLLDSMPFYGRNPNVKKFVSLETHHWVLSLQKALESCVITEPSLKKLAMSAFCSWVRAYSAHRGELKSIFMVKKLHLGHVAKSFALKEQPSLVGGSFQKQLKKRNRDQKHKGGSKRRRIISKS
ncbi:hypothetical protein DCAR_0313477 [Daucus carota subsp. sativus]|uniref:ATP-dependent RNA helicase n=1 Tax=Daucus carota subsp. sativus TaxID=79200 RepID=A0A162AM71_DAUCS|nr:PREDICTED: DEAD-box ATP-dependent RNA helicase 17 [Daucus carota subsp. sativus]WOG94184.1 hypothetical protein DCAR_0313477 [Daucus carota subsp. sativus]